MAKAELRLTLEQARRFLLVWQGLAGPRRFTGKAGVLAYVRQAGCLQFDPVDICGRNADLTLLARVKGYKPAMLERLLYKDRALVDHWDKNMSIYPVEDWRFFARNRRHPWGFGDPEVEAAAGPVLEVLREQGPCCTKDVQNALNLRHKVDWAWNPTNIARAALELLFFQGAAVVHHKTGTNRYFAPAESCLPPRLLQADEPHPQDGDYYAWHTLRRVGALGLLWNRPSGAFLAIHGYTAGVREQAFAGLLARGEIVPLAIEGIDTPFYLPKAALPTLEETLAAPRLAGRVEFIAPLDNLMWDRRLIEALFHFRYKWEVYTPVEKREYGHYVLPVLHVTRFAGRIQLQAKRKENTLLVAGYWHESKRKPAAAYLEKLHRRIALHAAFLGLKEVAYTESCGLEAP